MCACVCVCFHFLQRCKVVNSFYNVRIVDADQNTAIILLLQLLHVLKTGEIIFVDEVFHHNRMRKRLFLY